MHYTSIENIHKVIDPLFMDNLTEEFNEIKSLKTLNIRMRRFDELHDKIASLNFLDPAAGSGNFLTETYICLRRLENEILKEIHGAQIIMGQINNPIKVSISQFYGIEINDFAVSVARTALWIAESQMMRETEDIVNLNLDFLPLKTYPNIVEGNALSMEWEEVVSSQQLNYIMGNPPFVGARYMNTTQSNELKSVMGKVSGLGKLDYVTAWYKKAAEFIEGTDNIAAFVSTNSITQGEQVEPFWTNVFVEHNLNIEFAYQSFVWTNETRGGAAVHCVIIGFGKVSLKKKKLYLSDLNMKLVDNISPYLLDAPSVVVKARAKPISPVIEAKTGTRIGAREYVFTEKEMQKFIKEEPLAKNYFHEYLGAEEFLNNKKRYCLYLEDCPAEKLRLMPKSREIIASVQSNRQKKNHKLKDFPRQYVKLNIPSSDYIFIPQVSSERRKYIPIGIVSKDVWTADPHFMIEGAGLYYFGILSSNVHMAWIKTVCGSLEMRFRYSNRIGYNNFPWPNASELDKERIEYTANLILEARRLNPNASLSDLYNLTTTHTELTIAHQENDKAVMEAYGFNWRTMKESECVDKLMKMYQELTKA